MNLLHVRLRISKVVKLSRCKYIKILPGFLYNWAAGSHTCVFCCDSAEETMTDNYLLLGYEFHFSIKQARSSLRRAPVGEHILCIYELFCDVNVSQITVTYSKL